MSGWFTFGTLSRRDLTQTVINNGGTITRDNYDDLEPSHHLRDRDFFVFLDRDGTGDIDRFDQHEFAYRLGDTGYGGRVLLDPAPTHSPLQLSAHGRINNCAVGDLSHALRFRDSLGFGLDNGPDGSRTAKYFNRGDSMSAEFAPGYRIEKVEFTAQVRYGGWTTLNFDFDGDIMKTGHYGAWWNKYYSDFELWLGCIKDEDRIEIDFVHQTLRINGEAVSNHRIEAFFDAGGAPEKFTLGSMAGLGVAFDHLVIKRSDILADDHSFAAVRELADLDVAGVVDNAIAHARNIQAIYDGGVFQDVFVADDETDLIFDFQADAIAIGDNTLATGKLHASVVRGENIAIGATTIELSAAATSQDGDAFTTAEAFGSVIGADLVFVLDVFAETSFEDSGPTAQTEVVYAIVALDFNDFDFADGPRTYMATSTSVIDPDLVSLDDVNIAMVDAFAEAVAEDTIVDVEVSSFALEGVLSEFVIAGIVGVGEDPPLA